MPKNKIKENISYESRKTDSKKNIKTKKSTNTVKSTFKCPAAECVLEFNSKRSLNVHLRNHNIFTDSVPCTICNKVFTRRDAMIVHRRIHTGELPHSCCYCDKKFRTSSSLTAHLRIHTGEKPFSCNICGNLYSSRFGLQIHKRTHGEKEYFSCLQCDKKYIYESGLKHHVKSAHRGEKPYSCNICNKSFADKQTLSRHLQIHADKKKYPCSLCTKSFVLKIDLDNHNRVHSGEKPFKCPQCILCFSRKTSLSKHVRKYHFQCKNCLIYHENAQLLERHEVTCLFSTSEPLSQPSKWSTILIEHLLINSEQKPASSLISENIDSNVKELQAGTSTSSNIKQKDNIIPELVSNEHNIELTEETASINDSNLINEIYVANYEVIESQPLTSTINELTADTFISEAESIQKNTIISKNVSAWSDNNVRLPMEKSPNNLAELKANEASGAENIKSTELAVHFQNRQLVVEKLHTEQKIRITLPSNLCSKSANGKPRKFIIIKEIID